MRFALLPRERFSMVRLPDRRPVEQTPRVNAKAKRLPTSLRVTLGALGVLGITLLVKARSLEPDPRGYGTHEQLGIAPCYFQKSTGLACPMCGGTTAWAHLLRGDLTLAAHANLGAMLLCAAVAVATMWIMIVAVRGRWQIPTPSWKATLVIASAWLAVVVLDWFRRIYFTM